MQSVADADEPTTEDAPEERPAARADAGPPVTRLGPNPVFMDRQLMTPRAPLAPGAGMGLYPLLPPPVVSPPAWAADPTGRHEYRWWSGWTWTDHVADGGEASEDPMP